MSGYCVHPSNPFSRASVLREVAQALRRHNSVQVVDHGHCGGLRRRGTLNESVDLRPY